MEFRVNTNSAVFVPSPFSSGQRLAKENSPVALAAVALPIVGLLLVIPLGSSSLGD